MKVLFFGDVVGKPGRLALKHFIKQKLDDIHLDFIIANGENAAGGNGITPDIADELFAYGVDAITMGNHVWDKKEIMEFINGEQRIIRPANYPPGTPGQGYRVLTTKTKEKIGIINLSGRVFLSNLDCPFRVGEQIVKEVKLITNNIIIDFHAEATSEKVAFGWFMDGKVSAICGTHTHVQTSDGRILPKGSAYITDIGMTGPKDSVLGVKTELVIQKFLTQMPVRFEIAAGGLLLVNGVFIDIDRNGKATQIEPLNISISAHVEGHR